MPTMIAMTSEDVAGNKATFAIFGPEPLKLVWAFLFSKMMFFNLFNTKLIDFKSNPLYNYFIAGKAGDRLFQHTVNWRSRYLNNTEVDFNA